MTSAIRWRILVLQVSLIVILGFAASMLYVGGTFVNTSIHNELAAQQIYFPPAGSPALSPKEFPELQQYAGQQVLDGVTAQAYANGFIGRHVENIAGGKTYAQVSTAALASPKDLKLQGQANALFKGETLRGLLLNTFGWGQVGQYAIFAAAGFAAAAVVLMGAFIFELMAARRPEAPAEARVRTGQVAHRLA